MTVSREELAATIDVAEWGWLRSHLERGGIVLVSRELDLTDIGMAVTRDDTATISRLITDGNIGKPTAEQIAAWDDNKGKQFNMLIVSPYILAQEL